MYTIKLFEKIKLSLSGILLLQEELVCELYKLYWNWAAELSGSNNENKEWFLIYTCYQALVDYPYHVQIYT